MPEEVSTPSETHEETVEGQLAVVPAAAVKKIAALSC